MRKLLPFNFDPPIKSYTHHAYRLSIMSVGDDYHPWLYSNFIQLCSKDLSLYSDGPIELYRFHTAAPHGFNIYAFEKYYRPPGFISHSIDRAIWGRTCKDFSSFIISSIDEGYYVWTHVDFYFLPESNAFKTRNFTHGVMVIGYDQTTQEFQIVGFDRHGNFTKTDVAFSYFHKALVHASFHIGQTEDIHLYKRQKVRFTLDIVWIKQQLLDYINSQNTSQRFRLFATPEEGIYYGLETYKKGILNHLKILKKRPSFFKIHIPHILWEHKKLMRQRISYLQSNGLLSSDTNLLADYLEIEQKSNRLRMMLFKFSMNHDIDLLERSRKLTQTISDKESNTLEALTHQLESI